MMSGNSRLGPAALLGLACIACIASVAAADSDWPQFRGPNASGVSPDGDLPVEFSPEKNVAWQVAVPPGRSSPIIIGHRLFVTAFDSDAWELQTLCFDRRDGSLLWTRHVVPGKLEEGGSRLGSPAAPTPCANGDAVFAYFGPFGVVSYDHEGEERWRKPLPTPTTQHGASSSPILAGDRLVLGRDADVGSHLLAVDTRTGETIWKRPRPSFRRGFSTPVLWPADEPRQVVIAGTLRLAAYGLEKGDKKWSVRGLPNEMVSTPVLGDGLIFAAGWTYGSGVARVPTFDEIVDADQDGDGELTRDEAPTGPAKQHFVYADADKDGKLTRSEWETIAEIFGASQNALIAVRPDGEGDVTDTHIAWTQRRGLPYVPSPLFYEGRVFIVKRGGIASCFDARTGEPHYHRSRLGALGNYYASPVAAAGKILTISQRGVAVVLRSAPKLEVLARNDLGEDTLATPAIVGARLYVRTERHLWAFGKDAAP